MTVTPLFRPEPHSRIVLPKVGRPIVGLIATINPSLALIATIESLLHAGVCLVLVANDGTYKDDGLAVLNTARKMQHVCVIDMPKNGGKSAALRAAYLELPEDPDIIIVQVDDDTLAGRSLKKPVRMITRHRRRTDIVDVRVETFDGKNLIGLIQQLDYWLINCTIKRLQDCLRARLWVSGASMMYTYNAGKVLLLPHAVTRTEDTEGRFRAIGAGLTLRYCSSREAAFKTMVPETMAGVRKQWQRWALGNGQVIKLHGLGGGNARIALVNLLSWIEMLVAPILQFFAGKWIGFIPYTPHVPAMDAASQLFLGGLITAIMWMLGFGIVIGIAGSIMLRRWKLLFVGVFIPLLSLWWTFHAIEGLAVARKHPTAAGMLAWQPPERMAAVGVDHVVIAGAPTGPTGTQQVLESLWDGWRHIRLPARSATLHRSSRPNTVTS